MKKREYFLKKLYLFLGKKNSTGRPKQDLNLQPSDVFNPMVSKSDALPLRHLADCMKTDYSAIRGLTLCCAQKLTGINTITSFTPIEFHPITVYDKQLHVIHAIDSERRYQADAEIC